MNPDRRSMLRNVAGGAILCLAAGRAGAQADKFLLPRPPGLPLPPRLLAPGAAQPVLLRAVRIDTEISGRMAQTQVELEFFNPNSRVLEGELQFPLRDGQTVVGLAMEVDGALREAVAVDKAHGEQVFDDVTRARIDPALLSATEGNNYKLRVYPIPALGPKRVLIRYTEVLSAQGQTLSFQLPLAYGERVAEFALAIRVSGAESAPRADAGALATPAFTATAAGHALEWRQRDLAPLGVLGVEFEVSRRGSVVTGERDGRRYFLAQLPVATERRTRAQVRRVTLVWDSSGSGAEREHGREFALLDAYFARRREVEVSLLRVRDAAEPAQRFAVSGGDWSALRRALEATVYDGATQLGAARPDPASGEVLLFSDGLSNYGDATMAPSKVPVFAVSAAGRSDGARLRAIAQASGGAYIDLLALSAAQAQALLLERGTQLVQMESNGARRLVADGSVAESGWLTLAGELRERETRVRLTLEHPGGAHQTVELPVDASAGSSALAPQAWARLQIAALQADEDGHRTEIRTLARDFAIVTRETSLIILDRAEDYARHDITPPPELADAVARLRAGAALARQRDRQVNIDRVAQLFADKQAWWQREFPKDDVPRKAARREADELSVRQLQESASTERRAEMPAARPAAPMMAPAATGAAVSDGALAKKAKEAGAAGAAPAVIRLRPAQRDAAYARRLAAAPTADLYRIYLDERSAQSDGTAFFLDAADLLFERGQPALALRVLSNLAEMDLENRQVLRILAQRLLQAGQPRLAVPLLRKVLVLAPHEPQSFRDLGLALAAAGQAQEAVEMLYEVVLRPWPRFAEIELIALAELNAIVAAQGRDLDTSRIDRRLLRNLPLELRAVLSWDTDNTDVDLWVTDPNGEPTYYGNRLSYQGGRMSPDATGGYGPEEYSLKKAKPGVYKVEAQFFGHRQQIVSAYTTIQLVLSIGFGTPRQADRRVTLRLREPKERVFVGEFEVGVKPG